MNRIDESFKIFKLCIATSVMNMQRSAGINNNILNGKLLKVHLHIKQKDIDKGFL